MLIIDAIFTIYFGDAPTNGGIE